MVTLLASPGFVSTISGDANCDHLVNDLDVSLLASNWQDSDTKTCWPDGDFNGDGTVNDLDVSLLASKWQQWDTGYIPPTSEESAPVPEPSTMVILLLGALMFLARRYR